MPKRSADSEPQQTQPTRRSVGGNAAPAADEGMGEFEDQWEDELSDEEIVNAGDLEGDDGESGSFHFLYLNSPSASFALCALLG
jgi:hypothetical protein